MELTGQILAVLLVGSTHYVDLGVGKDAVMYCASPTRAFLRFPDGKVLVGDWRQTDAGYFVKWEGGPGGTVTRIVTGNAEKF